MSRNISVLLLPVQNVRTGFSYTGQCQVRSIAQRTRDIFKAHHPWSSWLWGLVRRPYHGTVIMCRPVTELKMGVEEAEWEKVRRWSRNTALELHRQLPGSWVYYSKSFDLGSGAFSRNIDEVVTACKMLILVTDDNVAWKHFGVDDKRGAYGTGYIWYRETDHRHPFPQ